MRPRANSHRHDTRAKLLCLQGVSGEFLGLPRKLFAQIVVN
jgi:hypothetical protein